ncbi:MAG: hypothetical protein KC620_08085 [Myxococcales bacterium]|nr:hypothetical protein [Myxococcales bacterium]
MRAIFALIVGLSVLVGFGCEENLDPKTPVGALHTLRDAVLARDVPALLAASSKATHDHLAALHALLKEQRVAFDERYPEEHRGPAKVAYPKGALEATDSAALFAALVQPELEKLEGGEGLKYGLTAYGSPAVRDDRATVPTHSGESYEFVLEDGVWKTTAFERPLEQNLNRARLHQQTLEENLKVFEELKRREAEKKAKEAAEAEPPATP